jgi:tight adherence protein B
VPIEVALRMMAQRTNMAEYRFFAPAVALQVQTGGGLSEALDTLSDVVRKRLALRSRGFALTSEARTSALVLAVLPFFIGGTLALLSPGYLDVLFETDTGNEMLAVGAISLVIGIATMRTMIRRTLS